MASKDERSEELPVLIAQAGPLEGQRWTIDGIITIGRDPSANIIITTPDKQVSRHHASLKLAENGVHLKDLGSKNGTHHNGDRLVDPVMLEDGDTIQIAMAQQFVFLSSDATVPLQVKEMAPTTSEEKLLKVDKRARRVWVGDKELMPPLSVAQYTMLELLYAKDGQVVSRQKIIEAVWGEEQAYDVSNQALDALVRRLRDRLDEISGHEFVVTVRGHGLRLENPNQ